MSYSYSAAQIEGYVLKPEFDRDGLTWQSHHVTNPAVIRMKGERRVFLGYRAGGDRDHYCIRETDVMSSSLGLAVLDETAANVICRFPLPIMRIARKFPLPQSPEQYDTYCSEHGEEIAVMHDFRLYELDGYLYVIYHDGTINQAFDCIKRMKSSLFLEKVAESIELSKYSASELKEKWAELWWRDSVWETAGVDGSRLLFPTVEGRSSMKTDVIYFLLQTGEIQLMRRPVPDVSVLPTDHTLCGKRTIDGDQDFGVLEQCVRPGFFDNSHIGPNGMPTLAYIGTRAVYIDVCHGVNNPSLGKEEEFRWDMVYSPFFRVKDAQSGELLYYSDNPIIDPESHIWEEYTRHGRWIQAIPHCYIAFAGGQTERVQGRNSENDLFTFFSGVGDTAIVRAEFTIRGLLPPDVLTDIQVQKSHRELRSEIPGACYEFPHPILGWNWKIEQNTVDGGLSVVRNYLFPQGADTAVRPIRVRPGYFDADMMLFDGESVGYEDSLGYYVLYQGVRWSEENLIRKTVSGWGVLVLDKENPERILYRSSEPLSEPMTEDGFFIPARQPAPKDLLNHIKQLIPQQVQFEIARSEKLVQEGKHWRSHYTIWLEERVKRAESQRNSH